MQPHSLLGMRRDAIDLTLISPRNYFLYTCAALGPIAVACACVLTESCSACAASFLLRRFPEGLQLRVCRRTFCHDRLAMTGSHDTAGQNGVSSKPTMCCLGRCCLRWRPAPWRSAPSWSLCGES